MEQPETFGIGQLMQMLRADYEGAEPPYLQVLGLVHSGAIPAEFVSARWRVNRADLPQAAAALGMTRRTDRQHSEAAA